MSGRGGNKRVKQINGVIRRHTVVRGETAAGGLSTRKKKPTNLRQAALASSSSATPPIVENESLGGPAFDLGDDPALTPPPSSDIPAKKRQRATTSLSNLLGAWLPACQQKWAEYFVEVTEIPSFDDACCSACKPDSLVYWCQDCTGPRYSLECLLHEHAKLPFHRIMVSRGSYYERVSLTELGLVVQLNHGRESCAAPRPFVRDFTVIHVNGQHTIKIAYCGCRSHVAGNSNIMQLFRQRWLPATWNAPRTVFTFEFLNTFHLLNLQSKCNLYDYYHATLRQTNNADLQHQPDKYNEVSFAVRIWRHLKQLKRAGRVHDPSGVAKIKPGELTHRCPACPDPERNLPENWKDAPPEDEYTTNWGAHGAEMNGRQGGCIPGHMSST